MIIKILIILPLLAAIFVVVVALRPADFRVARSISVTGPPAVAFAQANDLHKWQEMSPYAKLDPAAKYTFEGPPAGAGASLSWVGNRQVGQGRMSIAESRANELVRMNLEFLKPFIANNTAEFTFQPDGDRTQVTWSMAGRNNFMCKAAGLFMNCDKMIGSQFEEGLANLKVIAEAQAENLQSAR